MQPQCKKINLSTTNQTKKSTTESLNTTTMKDSCKIIIGNIIFYAEVKAYATLMAALSTLRKDQLLNEAYAEFLELKMADMLMEQLAETNATQISMKEARRVVKALNAPHENKHTSTLLSRKYHTRPAITTQRQTVNSALTTGFFGVSITQLFTALTLAMVKV